MLFLKDGKVTLGGTPFGMLLLMVSAPLWLRVSGSVLLLGTEVVVLTGAVLCLLALRLSSRRVAAAGGGGSPLPPSS